MRMRFLAVDDEPLALERLLHILQEAEPGCEARGFSSGGAAVEELTENGFAPDVAFLDIDLWDISGLELAKRVREHSRGTRVVFVTAYSEYTREAYALHASGYLLKPVYAQMVREELDEIVRPLPAASTQLKVQCFGNFEVFSGGEPMRFARSKSKELLAYLIHRSGSACSTRELAAVLFEDRPYTLSLQSQLQSVISTMLHTLDAVNARDVVIRRRNALSVEPARLDCDLYRFLRLDVDAVNAYMGEYMAQYDWAEFTLGYLDKLVAQK